MDQFQILVIYPSPAWLIFSCTVTLSYLKYVSPQGIMPTWILLAEYLPLFALLAAGNILRDRLKGSSFRVEGAEVGERISEVRSHQISNPIQSENGTNDLWVAAGNGG